MRGSTCLSEHQRKEKVLPPGRETSRAQLAPAPRTAQLLRKVPTEASGRDVTRSQGRHSQASLWDSYSHSWPGDGKEVPPTPAPLFPSGPGPPWACRPGRGANRVESSPCSPTGHPPSAIKVRAPPPASPAQVEESSSLFYSARRPSHPPQEPAQHPPCRLCPERCAISGQER